MDVCHGEVFLVPAANERQVPLFDFLPEMLVLGEEGVDPFQLSREVANALAVDREPPQTEETRFPRIAVLERFLGQRRNLPGFDIVGVEFLQDAPSRESDHLDRKSTSMNSSH